MTRRCARVINANKQLTGLAVGPLTAHFSLAHYSCVAILGATKQQF